MQPLKTAAKQNGRCYPPFTKEFQQSRGKDQEHFSALSSEQTAASAQRW
jgi:hypothetical protein